MAGRGSLSWPANTVAGPDLLSWSRIMSNLSAIASGGRGTRGEGTVGKTSLLLS